MSLALCPDFRAHLSTTTVGVGGAAEMPSSGIHPSNLLRPICSMHDDISARCLGNA